MNGIRITAVLTVAVMLFAALAVAIPADVDAAGTGSHLKGFEYSLDKSDVQNYLVDNGILDKDQKLDDMLGLLADVYVAKYLGSGYDVTFKTDFKIYAGVLTDSRGDKVSDKVAYSIYCDVEASVTGQFSEDANDLPSMVDGSSSTVDIKTKERTLTFGISLVSEGYIGDTTYFNGNELVGTDLSVTSRTDVTITSPVEFSITDGKLAMSYKKTNYEFALGGTDSIKLTAEGLVVDNSAQSWNVDADVKVTELKSSNYIQYPKKIGEAIAGYIGPSEKDYINSVYDGLYDMIKSGKIEIVTKENPLADVTLKISGVAKKETTENDFEYVVIGSPNYANGPALAAGNDQTADPTNLILSLIDLMNTNAIVDVIKSIDTEELAKYIRTVDFLPILDDFSIPTVDVSDLSSIDLESVYKALADKLSKMDWDAVAEAIKEKDFRPVTHALQDRIANLTDEEKQAILSFFHINGDDVSGSDRVYVLGQKNENQVFVVTDYLSVSLLNKESYAQVSDWTVDYVVNYYENSPLTQIGTVVYGDLSDSQANQIQKSIDKVADSSSSSGSGSDGKLFDYIWLIVIIVALIGGAAAANYYRKNKKN